MARAPTYDRDSLAELYAAVEPPDPYNVRLSAVRQRTRARPAGSLGQLDELVHRVAGIRRVPSPGPLPAVVGVLAADHGVAVHGISAVPPRLTGRVLALIATGKAPVNILAARVPARVECADVGLIRPVGDQRYKIAAGTQDICVRDAMTIQQARQAIAAGAAFAADRLNREPLLAVGEIGVGNTTVTAALGARLLGAAVADMVGAGSGVNAAKVRRKRDLVERALQRTRELPDEPLRLLAALGGFEIAANVGVILAAAGRHQVVVLDGFISAVAALVAVRLCPAAAGYLVAGHLSAEPGHRLLLAELGQRPLLSLDMKLGMGAGATAALGLVNAALAVADQTPAAQSVGLVLPPVTRGVGPEDRGAGKTASGRGVGRPGPESGGR